jgi:MerR family copper efflux transcriptional regulator
MRGLKVGELALQAGVTAPTIRYYERIGLLRQPLRSSSGYRLYGQRALNEISFIKRAQAIGLSLPQIQELLEMRRAGKKPCPRMITLAENQLAVIEERIQQMLHFRKHLAANLKRWKRACPFGPGGLCEMIDPAVLRVDGQPANIKVGRLG